MLTTVNPPNAVAVGPYSSATDSNGMLFCSGQTPLDPATGSPVSGGVHFAEPFPARTTIGVAALPLGADVEIEFVADTDDVDR